MIHIIATSTYMIIDKNYYEDNTRISNSNIGQFLKYGPLYLRKMLDGQAEGEKGPQLERGTLIHSYLLTPEEFYKTYVVWDKSRPFSAQQEKFCQALANTVEIEPNKAVLSAYKEVYSTAGKSEDKMLSEGLKIASTLKDYIDFLKLHDGRLMVSPSEAKMLEKIKQNVKNHKLAWKMLNVVNDAAELTDIEAHHEFHINWEHICTDTPGDSIIQCKSLLDSVYFDFRRKICNITDLKTTAKLWHFEESIEMYDYLRQLCYYMYAVRWYLKTEYNENPDDWDFDFNIIGIDTTGSYEIRVFEIEPYMVQSRKAIIDNALNDIRWHQKNNKWDHSREYYEGDGSENLNL